jgi:hypothetical protein
MYKIDCSNGIVIITSISINEDKAKEIYCLVYCTYMKKTKYSETCEETRGVDNMIICPLLKPFNCIATMFWSSEPTVHIPYIQHLIYYRYRYTINSLGYRECHLYMQHHSEIKMAYAFAYSRSLTTYWDTKSHFGMSDFYNKLGNAYKVGTQANLHH